MTGLLLHILFPNLSVCTKFVHLGFHERRGLKVSCGMHARQTRFTRLRNITSCFVMDFTRILSLPRVGVMSMLIALLIVAITLRLSWRAARRQMSRGRENVKSPGR